MMLLAEKNVAHPDELKAGISTDKQSCTAKAAFPVEGNFTHTHTQIQYIYFIVFLWRASFQQYLCAISFSCTATK